MAHTILTFVARVKPDKAAELAAMLKQIRTDGPETNALIPFRSLTSLHFASFVLHTTSAEYGPYLVFENNFDGPLDAYLEDLYRQAAEGLHQIYSCCADYAVTNAGDHGGMIDYLNRHVVRPAAYHIGNTGRSCPRILQENKLLDALEAQADALAPNCQSSSHSELFKKFQQFIRGNPGFSWVPGAGPRQSFAEKFIPWVKLVLVAVPLAPLILVTSIIWLPLLRYKESHDPVQSGAA